MVEATKVIRIKKEAVYGTDAMPTAAVNATLTRNFSGTPLVVDNIERNLDLPSRGRSRHANTNKRVPFSYELEIAGSGTVGEAAPWMEHLEGCGMAAPEVGAGVSAIQKFAPVGAPLSSLTAHWYDANQRKRPRGVRGSFSMDFTAGAYPFLSFTMMGLPPMAGGVVDISAPGVPDFSRWGDPVEVNTENTEFLLDGFAMVLQSFTLSDNATVNPRNLVGANYVRRGNHALTGRITAEAPDLASKNYFTALDSGAEMVVHLAHGSEAGNIVELDSAHLQFLSIETPADDDTLMMNISFGLNVGAGQDDLIITAK